MPTTNPSPHPLPDAATPAGRRYVLPCTPLHQGGLYEYVVLTVEQARAWLAVPPYQIAMPHPAWLALLALVIEPYAGTPLARCKTLRPRTPYPALGYADEALVFVVEGTDVPGYVWSLDDAARDKAVLERETYTFGVLRRLA